MNKQQLAELIALVREDEYRISNGNARHECRQAIKDHLTDAGFTVQDADDIVNTSDQLVNYN